MILLTESGTLNELKINKGKISNDGGLTAFKDAVIENQPDLLPGTTTGHFKKLRNQKVRAFSNQFCIENALTFSFRGICQHVNHSPFTNFLP